MICYNKIRRNSNKKTDGNQRSTGAKTSFQTKAWWDAGSKILSADSLGSICPYKEREIYLPSKSATASNIDNIKWQRSMPICAGRLWQSPDKIKEKSWKYGRRHPAGPYADILEGGSFPFPSPRSNARNSFVAAIENQHEQDNSRSNRSVINFMSILATIISCLGQYTYKVNANN